MATWNRWRDQYNPLRNLTIARAVSLLEAYVRGDMADLQWAYEFIEQTDPDLTALVERRSASVLELDWNIKMVSEDFPAWDEQLARDQQAALRLAYEGIDNLDESIEHLATASFRGFAHLEKWRNPDKSIYHLEQLDQWNVVRDGYKGDWKYNPEARMTSYRSLGDNMLLDEENWIIRETRRHIDRIGLIKFIRTNLGQKDWDGFIEIYGIPPVIITGPPGVTTDKEREYQEQAALVAEGGSGYLPNGSSVHTPDSTRGNNPFRDYLQYLTERMILAGTGGLLTMLTAPTGIGKGPSDEHADAFSSIAKAEARKISGILQRQIDTETLERLFPGKPVLAYWELAANEETDIGEIIDHAVKLSQAGLELDVDELAEKTGYTIRAKAAGPVENTGDELSDGEVDAEDGMDAEDAVTPIQNRDTNGGDASGLQQVITAISSDLRPVMQRLLSIVEIEDPEIRKTKLEVFREDYPQLAKDVLADPAAARVIEQKLSSAMAYGMASKMPQDDLEGIKVAETSSGQIAKGFQRIAKASSSRSNHPKTA